VGVGTDIPPTVTDLMDQVHRRLGTAIPTASDRPSERPMSPAHRDADASRNGKGPHR
jgi:hypothetical protein